MFLELISDTAYLRIHWKPPILLWLCWASTLTAMRVCVCVAVSASDLHTECLWQWDTLPSQICLKHCHNKPLNQSLVCAPSKASLFLLFPQVPTGTLYHTILLSASSTWHSSHCAPALLSCTYDPDAPQKQVWHKYRFKYNNNNDTFSFNNNLILLVNKKLI